MPEDLRHHVRTRRRIEPLPADNLVVVESDQVSRGIVVELVDLTPVGTRQCRPTALTDEHLVPMQVDLVQHVLEKACVLGCYNLYVCHEGPRAVECARTLAEFA